MRKARRWIVYLALSVAAPFLQLQSAAGYPLLTEPLVQVSGASPIAGCVLDGPQTGTIFENSEVEPFVVVNPADPDGAGPLAAGDNVIAAWQQDRYSDGGSQGLVTASSFDGGTTWTLNAATKSSVCTGGTTANGGGYERASDPWVAFTPDGTAYLMSLSVDNDPQAGGFVNASANAMIVMRSTNGGRTWEDPITLRRDDNPNILNDKNSLTADPNHPDFAYAVWDRLIAPPGGTPNQVAFENTVAGKGPTWFSRTTNGGDTWEAGRQIYQPSTLGQTIGNVIAVLPDNATFNGEVVDVFTLIRLNNRHQTRGIHIALIRSPDRGATWTKKEIIVDNFLRGIVNDPDDQQPVRTGDINAEVAVDQNTGALYVIWQDRRFGPRSSVAFSQSLDGGLTWSPTIKVNKTPTDIPLGNQQAFTPMVQVSADGTIGVSYYDFRNNPADPAVLGTDEFLVHCHPTTPTTCTNPANWGSEVRLTTSTFDMGKAPVARGFFTGDYEGLGVDGTDFLPLWSMPHGSDPSSVFVRRATP
jgi:hypothetical protein